MKQAYAVWLLAGLAALGGATANAADGSEREVGLLLGGGWADKELVGSKDGDVNPLLGLRYGHRLGYRFNFFGDVVGGPYNGNASNIDDLGIVTARGGLEWLFASGARYDWFLSGGVGAMYVYLSEDDDFIDLIADWPLIMDDAVANPSTVLLYALSRFAREAGYKVLLAGEGADEFFGGYHQQWRFAMAKKLNPAARFFPSIADGIERFAPHRTRLIHAAKLATGDCTFHGSSMIVEPWLAQELFAVPVGAAPFANTLNEALLLDQDYRLPDDMLTAADRATMHASVEARVPFVTRAVADFAASLEERHLISGFSQKVLLRKLARRHIPASCIDRRKVGFDLPLSRWFRTSLKERLLDALANTWQREFFREGALDKLVDWHLSGRANIPDKLWAFYLLEHNVRALRAIS